MQVSIIIVSYNTKGFTKKCLQSVFDKTKEIAFEVIVVDNASSDGSQQMLKEDFSNVILIESNENLGFGRANNLGINIAKGKNIFLLNPDTILINNAVKILSDFLDENKEVGVCGGNLYDENQNPNISFVRMLPSIKEELDQFFFYLPSQIIYGKNRQFNHTEKNIRVKAVIGADMMIRKKVLEETGAFDPDFFMYAEELELCYRINKANYKIKSIPSAKIIHLEGKSLSCNMERRKKMLNARTLYYKKTHNKATLIFANGIALLTCFLRIILFALARNKEKVFLWKFTMKNIR